MRASTGSLDVKPLLDLLSQLGAPKAKEWLSEGRHQDCQEAFQVVIERIGEEQKAKAREQGGVPLVRSVFGVDLETRLVCRCGDGRVKHQLNVSVSVAIGNCTTLQGCLAAFASEGAVEEGTRCPHNVCRGVTNTQVTATTLGRVVAIQLNRFTNTLIKLDQHVSFPIELTREFLSESKLRGLEHGHLYAVVTHTGSSLHSGHYTIDVRHGSRWFRCEDENVSAISEEKVLDTQAYLLFYETDRIRVGPTLRGEINACLSKPDTSTSLSGVDFSHLYAARSDLNLLAGQASGLQLVTAALRASSAPSATANSGMVAAENVAAAELAAATNAADVGTEKGGAEKAVAENATPATLVVAAMLQKAAAEKAIVQ